MARNITARFAYKRMMALSELENPVGLCCWCNINPLPTTRHRYCSHICRESAYLFCYPQAPASKAYVLMKQQWACRICGLYYEEEAMATLRVWIKHQDFTPDQVQKADVCSVLYPIGYKISQSMDMDHIVPIFKGGVGIGHRNHQVICRTCHHQKTASER